MLLIDELAELKRELNALRAAQANTQKDYEGYLDSFAEKLAALDQKVNVQYAQEESGREVSELSSPLVNQQPAESLSATHVNHQANEVIASEDKAPEQVPSYRLSSEQLPRLTEQKTTNALDRAMTAAPDFIEQCTDFIIAPFAHLLAKGKGFYEHYQSRGLAAVFLMTVAGIITFTLGFGYLLQYSVNHWLSETGKVIFAFTASNGLLLGGLFIHKKRPGMQDFASGLVGLGLILNFLCTYFIGPYYQLISAPISFVLLFLITLSGLGLSLKLETKVVALISLLGGSLAPIMLLSQSLSPLLYLPYLLLIGGAAVWQSRWLTWPLLLEIVAFLHIACVESLLFYLGHASVSLDWPLLLAIVSINAMFFIYGFSQLLQPTQNKHQVALSGRLLVLPIVLMTFMLTAVTQLTHYNGEVFAINALFFVAIYLVTQYRTQAIGAQVKSLKTLAILLAGSFAGFAAFALLSQEYLGLVLILEALLLLWLGCKEQLKSVRGEAYLLLMLGVLSSLLGLAESIELGKYAFTHFVDYRFNVIQLILIASALYVAGYLMKQLFELSENSEQKSSFIPIEQTIYRIVKESLSIAYAACFLYISLILVYQHTLHLLPVLSLLLLLLAQREQLKVTEVLAWLCLLPLLGAIAFGIIETGVSRFSEQPFYAQLARIELFASFVLAYFWYQRFYPSSKIINMSFWLQLLTLFALPIVFLPKVLREYPDFISIALWLSCLMSVGLAWFTRHRLLILQSKLLVCSAILITAISCLLSLWQGLVALLVGALLLAYLYQQYLSLNRFFRILFRLHWQLSPYYFALVSVVIIHSLMTLLGLPHWGVAVATLSAYCVMLLKLAPSPLVLRCSYHILYVLIALTATYPLLLHVDSGVNLTLTSLLYMLSQMIILALLASLYRGNGSALRLISKHVPRLYLEWAWHSLFSLSYLLWCYQLSTIIAAPLSAILLVIHGSSLMFISLKEGQATTIKLAAALFIIACLKVLLVDMASFEVLQKVIAFMVIGAILLVVSYFYQKAKNRLNNATISE